jgi:putative transposase
MNAIDKIYTGHPYYGYRRITWALTRDGWRVNHKRALRLMREMGIASIAPGPLTSKPHPEHKVYPYLLRDLKICRPNQVWCTDITYVPMRRGYMYLMAVLDWFSRFVLAWRLSNSLDVRFCLDALDDALSRGHPEIFNSDQGGQFTSKEFTGRLLDGGVKISMDGRGRAYDNIIAERFWRNVKYEHVYLHAPDSGTELQTGLAGYMGFYNTRRPHASLANAHPLDVYTGKVEVACG